jgi:mannose-6-phosphate isomerase-like protein (cupin superfamily)
MGTSTDTFVIKQTGDEPWESSDSLGLPGGKHYTYKEGDDDGIRGIIGTFPPGYVEPEHVHDDTDHWCVIIDGEMHVDGKVLTRGDYIYAPRGVRHGPFHYPVGAMIFANVRGGDFVHHFDTEPGVPDAG